MKYLLRLFFFSLLFGHSPADMGQGLPIKPVRTVTFDTREGSYMNVDISPDGKVLIFDLLGDLYTVPASGGPTTQLTRGMAINVRPQWSPDGKHIAYISDVSGAMRLTVMDVAGRFHKAVGPEFTEWQYGIT